MNKQPKLLNEDEVMRQKLEKCIHATFGRFICYVRTISPLSHEEMQELSSITSGTAWRMEKSRNYKILSYAQAFYVHLRALKCEFHIQNLRRATTQALEEGKCLVISVIDKDEINNYNKNAILFAQAPTDEELERRRKARKALLKRNAKFGKNKKNNKTEKKPADKKKIKKR